MTHSHYLGRPELGAADVSTSVAALIASTRRALTQETPVAAHNAFTHYVGLLLLTTTGHRPVHDPFCCRRQIAIEHQCALINDKAVSERHHYRLISLCATAREQIRAYDAHRNHLGQWLMQQSPLEARAVGKILVQGAEVDAANRIPFLFYLGDKLLTQSVTPSRLRAGLGQLWPFALNLGRYAISTHLRVLDVPEALISLQLNHLHEHYHPLGPSSLLCPAQCGRQLQAALQCLADAQSWQVLTGLPAAKATARGETVMPGFRGPVHERPLLGPELRALARRRQRNEDAESVRAVLGASDLRAVDKARLPQTIEMLVEQLKAGAGGDVDRAARRINLLWRMLRRTGGARIQALLPRRLIVLEPEPSPISADHLSHLQAACSFTCRFASHIAQAGDAGAPVDPATRIAELIILAAFWGGVSHSQRLEGLAAALPRQVYASERVVWIEVPRPGRKHPLWRWFPDPAAQAFLHGLRRTQKGRQDLPALSAILRVLENWLASWQTGVTQGSAFERLARLSGAWWTHYAPATASHLARGKIASQPLPLSAWLRLLTGQRPAPDPSPTAMVPTPAIPWLPTLAPVDAADRTAFRQRVTQILHDTEQGAPRGHERRSGGMKARLAHALQALGGTPQPPIAALLLAWGVHLCAQGTRTKADLAGSTPVTYLRTLLLPLAESGWQENPFHMSDAELADLYQQALSYAATPQSAAYLAGRLAEFHAFAAGHCGLADVDPSVFVPSAAPVERIPDANLLLHWEYARALEWLYTDPSSNDADRHHLVSMLMLGYRFGLRIGEVADLLAQDLCVVEGRLCYLSVHGDVFGDRKSRRATRCVPLLGALSPIEADTTAVLLERARQTTDAHAPLFAAGPDRRDRIDILGLQTRIQLALHQVTGDPTLRYHHLRHTFANRLFASLIGPDGSTTWQQVHAKLAFEGLSAAAVRTQLTGSPELDNATLYAMATLLGHAETSTTFCHYLHIIDVWLPGSHQLIASR